jgi:thiosulfate dehydrogenase (quinone) large subunit
MGASVLDEWRAMMDSVTADRAVASPRTLGGGFAALRILFGLVWLSNGLTKVFFQDSNFELGGVKFNLINRPAARSILEGASAGTFQPLRWIYHDFVLGNWGFFQWFLTVAEVVAGLLLILGIASRLGALIGLGLIGPIWVMLLGSNLYFWEYPVELVPLLILAIVPSGRTFGRDRMLAPRFGGRWPF